MPRHDPIWKSLIQTFLGDFVHLVAPEVAAGLDFETVRFLDRESFTDLPARVRSELDVVAEVPERGGGAQLVLIHVEVEGRYRRTMGPRMLRYYRHLRLRYPKLPVLPVVLFLRGGPRGVELLEVREQVLDGPEISVFRFVAFGVSRCEAAEYLSRPEPMSWALASLMRAPGGDRVALKLGCLRPIAEADLDEARRFLLLNTVETYVELSEEESSRFAASLVDETEEVKAMETTWADKLVAKGVKEGVVTGRREGMVDTTVRLLEKRFGRLPGASRRRIDGLDERGLEALADRLLDAASLQDLGLD
ncbi:MAG: DUF4351 domain-containing protein [Acidobacteriota bacterium]